MYIIFQNLKGCFPQKNIFDIMTFDALSLFGVTICILIQKAQ